MCYLSEPAPICLALHRDLANIPFNQKDIKLKDRKLMHRDVTFETPWAALFNKWVIWNSIAHSQ